jgi:hypothetical protein
MVVSFAGLGFKSDCSGKAQNQLNSKLQTRPLVREGATKYRVPGGYKYGKLSLQVGGVSDETLKYGREFCGTSTQE